MGEYTMLMYICAWIMLPAFRNATDSGIFRFVFFCGLRNMVHYKHNGKK